MVLNDSQCWQFAAEKKSITGEPIKCALPHQAGEKYSIIQKMPSMISS